MIPSAAISVRSRIALLALALPLLAAGCTPKIANLGNMLDDDRIAQVKPGLSSKNDVYEALGSPSMVSTFDDNTWYYVGQRMEQEAIFAPVVTDSKIVLVRFDDTDHVRTVDRVGLDQLKEIQPLDRKTPAAGRELNFMEQLLGNIGRAGSDKKKKSSGSGGGGDR